MFQAGGSKAARFSTPRPSRHLRFQNLPEGWSPLYMTKKQRSIWRRVW